MLELSRWSSMLILFIFQMFIIRFVKRNFTNFVHIICLLIFLVQICWITFAFIWPDTFNTVSYKEELDKNEFPVHIQVCVIPGFDDKQLLNAGYANHNFFKGMSRFNSSVYGWTGHYRQRQGNLSAEGEK